MKGSEPMARAPDPRVEKAHNLYKQGLKLVEIANQLNIPDGTVRRWKSTYKWDGERSEINNERSEKKSEQSKKKDKVVAKEVESVLENTELTDKQRLFCLYYSKTFNATRSYQKAYGVDYLSACASGPRLLDNVRVREEIIRLKEQRYSQALLKPEDIFQKYLEIAYADITDFTSFGKKDIEYVDKNGNEHTATISYVDVNESSEVDGTLITEVSQGKDGIKVKLADKMKALQWLTDHMNMATEEQKTRIAMMKAKIDTDDEEDIADDGFLDALNSTASGDWSNEE